MLQGRVAPPPSPAVHADAPPPRPLPVSRRNSFSRDMAASIAQTRSPSVVDLNIQLHVKNDTLRPLSPRKSASFTLPRTPRQNDGVSNSEAARALRSTSSEVQLSRLLDEPSSFAIPLRQVSEPITGASDLDDHEDASAISPTRKDDEDDDDDRNDDSDSDSESILDDPDGFETWLQEVHVLESPIPASKRDDTSQPWTQPLSHLAAEVLDQSDSAFPDRTASLELSKSVQQIEHEIRLAIDSAASRVAGHAERSEPFAHELHMHGHITTPSLLTSEIKCLTGKLQDAPNELELLLLMDVLIGDGRSETIEIYVGDQPNHLAEAFAAKHGLGPEAIPKLTQHIQDELNALEEEEEVEEEEEIVALQAPMNGASSVVDQHHGDDHNHNSEEDFQDDRSAFDDFNDDDDNVHYERSPPSQQLYQQPPPNGQHHEHEREHKYNHLMEKYGHYTSHSNRVNTQSRTSHPQYRHDDPSDRLTMRNVELSDHARLQFTPRPVAFSSSGSRHPGKDKETVYNRLYALAESREKWIRRQQKAKAADEVREQQAMMKLEISAKSRDMVAGRGDGGYAHIGERLYDQALSDLAKKQRECDKRERERVLPSDWTCPKCACVNQSSDAMCKNVVASALDTGIGVTRRETLTAAALVDAHPEVACGHLRPDELFRPTLIVAPASVMRAVHHNKLRATASAASSQRQRTQQQREDEFRQTCPFKPKINEMSEEIMRDKLQQEAKAGGGVPTTTAAGDVRRKNPHQALYEDAFHARAQREAREEAHLKQFPFKPNIGVNALWSKRSNDDADADVVKRLAVSKYQELEHKRLSLHAKYAPDRDPTTGREYFKPETGRAPIFNRNERGLPIGDFLYEAHKEQAEYLRRLRQQESDECRQRSEQRFVSAKSEQALADRKKNTFARLFAWLLKNQSLQQESDGQIDDGVPRVVPSALTTSTLAPEVARIVSIVIEFANHEPFTFDAFELFMEKLIADVPGLTYTQVLFVTEHLNDGKSARRPVERGASDDAADDVELTFRPAIDKNSDALAKKHGRGDRPSVFEALNQYHDHYKERQTQATKQREREFQRTHPFQPTFYSKDRKAKAAKFYKKLHHQERSTTIGATAVQLSAKDATPSLRTAVPNARPFVRPLGRTPSDQTLRSRSSSIAGDGDDDDAALTSHVLAALDDRAVPPPPPMRTPTIQPSAASYSAPFMARFSSASPSIASSSSTVSTDVAPSALD